MTMGKKRAPRMTAIPAATAAAILLAGCSSGHIGEDWQCPLAAGGSCASVAAADPAVPKTGAAQTTGQPIRLLPLEWDTEETAATPVREPERQRSTPTRSCEAACGFDPFAWLARLFGAETEDGGERPATPEPAVLPAETTQTDAASGDDGMPTDDLRTGEVVARIWIAPFVDADGIYREASHVRVVLEPAGWRLP